MHARQGKLAEEFRTDGHASIGYSLTDDPTNVYDLEEIRDAFRAVKSNPDHKSTVTRIARQI